MDQQAAGFEAWAVVEIMGHKQLAGRVTEQAIAGVNMLRIDIPEAAGFPAQTVYHGGAAVYAIHPCTEEIARTAAGRLRLSGADPFPVCVPELEEARRTLALAARTGQHTPPALVAGDEEDEWPDGPF